MADTQTLTQTLLVKENATPAMKAVEVTSGERWDGIDVGVVNDVFAWDRCPAHMLSWLANHVGVDLWYDDWPEARKRKAIRDFPRLKKLKGTVAGFRGYLELVDVPLVDAVLPPQEGTYGEVLTGQARADWLALMPQMRLYRYRETAPVEEAEGFYDDDAVLDDDTSLGIDPAPGFNGTRAFIWRRGQEEPLRLLDVTYSADEVRRLERVQVAMPAEPSNAYNVDGPFETPLLDAEDERALIYTAHLASASMEITSEQTVTRLTPALTPIDVRYEDVFEAVATRADDTFVEDDTAWDEGLLFGVDDAGDHVYHRVYLLDPSVPVPDLEGGYDLDDHLYGLPPYHAILKVDLTEPADGGPEVYDDDEGYFVDLAQPRLERALEAIRRAQGDTDVIVVDSTSFSPIRLGDPWPLDGSIRLGQMIERF